MDDGTLHDLVENSGDNKHAILQELRYETMDNLEKLLYLFETVLYEHQVMQQQIIILTKEVKQLKGDGRNGDS